MPRVARENILKNQILKKKLFLIFYYYTLFIDFIDVLKTYCCIYIKFLPINGLTDLAQICLRPRMTPRKVYKCKITK